MPKIQVLIDKHFYRWTENILNDVNNFLIYLTHNIFVVNKFIRKNIMQFKTALFLLSISIFSTSDVVGKGGGGGGGGAATGAAANAAASSGGGGSSTYDPYGGANAQAWFAQQDQAASASTNDKDKKDKDKKDKDKKDKDKKDKDKKDKDKKDKDKKDKDKKDKDKKDKDKAHYLK